MGGEKQNEGDQSISDEPAKGKGRHEVDPPQERVDDETSAKDSKTTHRQE